MSVIEQFNKNLPKPINTRGENYEALIGKEEFLPEPVITEAADFNCGAICNEYEYIYLNVDEFKKQLRIDTSEGDYLNDLVGSFADLQRRGLSEGDVVYRSRLRALLAQKTNPRRATKWAIRNAFDYVTTLGVDVVEKFDTKNLYFELRVRGSSSSEDGLFVDQGFLDNEFTGGIGVGSASTFIPDLLRRVRAAGVEAVVVYSLLGVIELTSDATVS